MRPERLVRRLLRAAGFEAYRLRRSTVYAWHPDDRILRVSPGGGFFYQPCIDPRGEEVAYHGNTRGPFRIWVADAASGQATALTGTDSTAVHPSYSWDGSRIVFASDEAGETSPVDVRDLRPDSFEESRLSLYVMGRDGSDRRRITFGNGLDRRPCFGPDGDSVAFLSNRSGSQDIWVTAAGADAEPRCLEVGRQGWGPGRPWFAADASVIYFYARRRGEGRDRICRVPAGGGPVEPLAEDDHGDSHGPFVDWDGRSLLMHSTRGGVFNLWEIPLTGGPPRSVSPPGFEQALHASRSRSGVVAFDVPGRGPRRLRLRRGAPS